jgi:hypothetical protein
MDIGKSEMVLAFEGHFFVTSQDGNCLELSQYGTPIALSLLLKKQEIDLLHFPVLGAWRVPYWDNSKQLPSWDVTKKCP